MRAVICFAAGHGERSLQPPTLRERRHRRLACRRVAVRRLTVLVMAERLPRGSISVSHPLIVSLRDLEKDPREFRPVAQVAASRYVKRSAR
jgi:hypothetical protein